MHYFIILGPPFETDYVDSKGYWLKPDGRTHEIRLKKLRSEISKAMVALLGFVDKERPRIIIGEGQGGVVVALSSFPLIMERACRERAVTEDQIAGYRRAWSGVTGLAVFL